MDQYSLEYFCETQAKLHSICIRIYQDDSLTSLLKFFGNNYVGNDIKDIPINMTVNSFNSKKHIAVYDETQFLLGYIKDEASNNSLLIGPVRLGEITESDVSTLIRKYSLPQILQDSIMHFLLSTPVIPIENFLVLLSAFNLVINNKVVLVQQIMQDNSDVISQIESKDSFIETADIETPRPTGKYEETVIYYIKNGMVDEIDNLNYEHFNGKIGKLGPNQLRSLKNALIILNSMCLRAAISGGLDSETAYSLGERYAQRIENSSSIAELGQLSPIIRKDYCLRVKNLSLPKIDNIYILKITDYIQKNIYTKITVSDLANHVNIDPKYLASLCQQSLHCTASQYIMQRKISEAKKLLRFTDKSLAEISELLCFSSQSHFQRQFKKIRGMTPKEYREKYNKKE